MKKAISAGDLTKRSRTLFFIAVMLSNIVVMGDCVLYPITNDIYAAYPDAVQGVNYILSGPPLLLVVASLIAPFILKKVSKRTLLIIGSALFTVGAVFGVAFDNVEWMMFTRSLVGIGQGFVNVCSISLIADVYVDEDVRSRFIGFFNASMNLIAMVFQFAAGFLAVSAWQDVFGLYLTSIPMLIMIILFIPKIKANDTLVEESAGSEGEVKKKGMGSEFWLILVTFFLASTVSMVVAYFMSVYVAENALGDATIVATAGSISQGFALATGLAFGLIYTKMRRFTLVLAYVAIAIAFVSWAVLPPAVALVFVVYILQCIGYTVGFSYCYARCPIIVPPSRVDLSIGLVTAGYGIASFVSTYFVIFVEGLMGTESFTVTLPIYAAIAVAVTVVGVIFTLALRKKDVHPVETS